MDATCGTAEYMSPEMLEGELYSSLVDLWALGIIVFAMVSGELPFKDQNRTQLHEKIMNGLYSLESEVIEYKPKYAHFIASIYIKINASNDTLLECLCTNFLLGKHLHVMILTCGLNLCNILLSVI